MYMPRPNGLILSFCVINFSLATKWPNYQRSKMVADTKSHFATLLFHAKLSMIQAKVHSTIFWKTLVHF